MLNSNYIFKFYLNRIWIRHGKEVVRRTDRWKEAVCEQSDDRHTGVELAGMRPLVDRKHALGCNLRQDRIKRKSARAARNLDTIQRIVHSLFSIWKGLRKKRNDKKKGMAELLREVSMGFTRLLRFLRQKWQKNRFWKKHNFLTYNNKENTRFAMDRVRGNISLLLL